MSPLNLVSPLAILEIIDYLYANGEGTFYDLVSETNLSRVEASRAEISLAVANNEHILTVTEKSDPEGRVRPYYSLAYSELAFIGAKARYRKALEINQACQEDHRSMFDMHDVSGITSLLPREAREIMTNSPDLFKFLGYQDSPVFTCNRYVQSEGTS